MLNHKIDFKIKNFNFFSYLYWFLCINRWLDCLNRTFDSLKTMRKFGKQKAYLESSKRLEIQTNFLICFILIV